MPEKKGLWGSLFSRSAKSTGKQESTGNLPSVLRDQFGITIIEDGLSLMDARSRGYRRMSETEIGRIDALVQYIPQIAAQNATAQATSQVFRTAVEGSYRCILKPGQHLAQSRLTPGAVRGIGLSNATNQVAGSAEWIPNDAVLSISNAPQIALGVFNAVSMITGQYFMSQINGKLATLEEDISRIEGFLEATQRSKLKAAYQELTDIIARLDFIKNHPEQIRSTIDQLHVIQRTAQESINLCLEMIQTESQLASAQDKEDIIEKRIGNIAKYLNQQMVSVQIYSVATLLEIQLNDVDATEELVAYKKQIEKRVAEYRESLEAARSVIEKYLDESHVLNDRSLLQNIATAGTAVASTFLGGIMGLIGGIKLSNKVDEWFSDDQKRRKASHIDLANAYLASVSDEGVLEAPLETIGRMIQVSEEGVEIVLIDGTWYTNLPE